MLFKVDDLVKSRNSIKFVIPAKAGIPYSYFKAFWTPAFAGVTLQETFYEIIKVDSAVGVIPP